MGIDGGIANGILVSGASSVLNGTKASKIKEFTFDGHTFVQSHLAHMATEMAHSMGLLKVDYDSSLNGKAEYDSKENTLYLGFFYPDSLPKEALIIHEATHALFDFKASNMDIATSESIAYIAQCQYARANNPSSDPEDRLYSENERKDKVFEIAWKLAGKILDDEQLDLTDVTEMRDAVSRHPFYASNHGDNADFDGM